MNILVTSNRFFPDIGGIETVSDLLCHSFVAAGHSLRLVTQSLGNPAQDIASFPFLILRRPTPCQLLASYRWADVVLQNNIELQTLWPQLMFRRPLLIALHTWLRSPGGQRRLVDRLKQVVLFSANHVVAISHAIRLDSFKRACVVANPYNSQLFRPIPAIQRQHSIVFLGRLVTDKGVDLLLHSFAALRRPDWQLTIIGDGPERQALELLASRLRIASVVHFRGAISGESLAQELNRHELMVIPSRWREPFGVVALEAMACGCVVLASNDGGLPDAVGAAGILFRRGDQHDLTRQLERLLADPDLRERLRRAAPPHLALFHEDQICSNYLSRLEAVAQRQHVRV